MRQRQRVEVSDFIFYAILLIGIIAVGVILMTFVKVKGLLGPVFGIAALVLLVYWFREFKRTAKEELLPAARSPSRGWTYDVIKDEYGITVVAWVPGPEEQVRVQLAGRALKIRGGSGFQKTVDLPEKTEITNMTYVNGILNVRLRKLI